MRPKPKKVLSKPSKRVMMLKMQSLLNNLFKKIGMSFLTSRAPKQWKPPGVRKFSMIQKLNSLKICSPVHPHYQVIQKLRDQDKLRLNLKNLLGISRPLAA